MSQAAVKRYIFPCDMDRDLSGSKVPDAIQRASALTELVDSTPQGISDQWQLRGICLQSNHKEKTFTRQVLVKNVCFGKLRLESTDQRFLE